MQAAVMWNLPYLKCLQAIICYLFLHFVHMGLSRQDRTGINSTVELPNEIDSNFILNVVSDDVASFKQDTEVLLF